jgi:cytochrome c-type biogenesis protein CcmH/NrfF
MLWAPAAHAAPEDVANSISREVMSPFCPGVTLHDCPSDTSLALRSRIEAWAVDGWSRERIMNELEEQYGPSIRAVPGVGGSGLGAWLVPGLAVGLGGTLLYLLLQRWTHRHPAPAVSVGSGATFTERDRIESELQRLRDQT